MEEELSELHLELKQAKEERCEALQELEEMKWRMYCMTDKFSSCKKMEILATEADKAKESERRMLESLACQTKQLEQTKMMLEEAKLDIKSLNGTINDLEGSSSRLSRVFGKSMTFGVARSSDELGTLRTELKLAWQAEEKCKKAMDDLALALKEVTTEKNQVKEKLSETQMEMERMKAEQEEMKVQLNRAEVKLMLALKESQLLRLEAEESFLIWREKENGFINCMQLCEEDVINLQKQNDRLIDSQSSAREEISKLRDILKQAINEANVVKEALEITRNENSQLKDALAEKDKAIQSIKQALEGHKIREATALDRVKELQSLLAATSSMDISRNFSPIETAPFRSPKASPYVTRVSKSIAKYPSENWTRNPGSSNERRFSLGDSDRFDGSIFDMFDTPEPKKDKATLQENKHFWRGMNFDERDRERQFDGLDNGWDTPTRLKKKKQILRKFGELLRKRSFHHK